MYIVKEIGILIRPSRGRMLFVFSLQTYNPFGIKKDSFIIGRHTISIIVKELSNPKDSTVYSKRDWHFNTTLSGSNVVVCVKFNYAE